MKHTRSAGFSLIILLIAGGLILSFILISMAALKQSQQHTANNAESNEVYSTKADDRRPLLLNLGGIHPAKDIKQDLMLIDSSRDIEVETYLFGQTIKNTYQADRTNTSFDFRGISKPLDVVAPFDGKVVGIKDRQAAGDAYEISFAAGDYSTWIVILGHVTDPAVKQGDAVTAGQKLAKAAPYLAGTYRYSFQVVHKSTTADELVEYVCPTTLLVEKFRRSYVAEMNQLTAAWTAFRGHDFYGSHDGGCVVPEIDAAGLDV